MVIMYMNNVNTTEQLIQEVRARPPLWDQRNLNYHNRVTVNTLWQDIADLLQVNKETVKIKWKGLRDTYRRELKKQRSTSQIQNGGETARDPSWTHYTSMNFLREYMGSSNNHSDLFQFQGWSTNDLTADEATSPTAEPFSPFVPTTSIAEDIIAVTANSAKDGAVESSSGEEKAHIHTKAEQVSSPAENDVVDTVFSPIRQPIAAKRRRLPPRLSRLKGQRLKSRLPRKHQPKQPSANRIVHSTVTVADSDDDLYFFKSLIPYVRSLPPTRKLYLRAEIHNLVLREIMSGDTNAHGLIPLEHVSVGMNP